MVGAYGMCGEVNAYRVLVGIHIQNSLGLDGRIILKWILQK